MKNNIIVVNKLAMKEVAALLNIDLTDINIDSIAGFDKNGIIFNDINSIIEFVNKQKIDEENSRKKVLEKICKLPYDELILLLNEYNKYNSDCINDKFRSNPIIPLIEFYESKYIDIKQQKGVYNGS